MTLPRLLRPRKSPKQGRSRALVEALLDATARILVSRGYTEMAMEDVAGLAGASVGSLYQYFPHKEALVVGLIERHADREVAFLEARFAALQPSSIETIVEATVRAVLAFRAEDPKLHQALLDAIPLVGRYYDLRQRGAQGAMRLRELFGAALPSQAGGPSLNELVFIVGNATHSLTHEGLLPRPATLDDARLGREIVRLVLGYLQAVRSADGA